MLLEVAETRRADAGLADVGFVQGDVRTFDAGRRFDAVVGRLILFHLADPVAVVRHHLGALRPGGTVAMVDFDLGVARIEPRVPLSSLFDRIEVAFRAAGANPRIGARLTRILQEADLEQVVSYGFQRYLGPDDPGGPRLLAGVIRSLAPTMVSKGIATEEEFDLATLEQRIRDSWSRTTRSSSRPRSPAPGAAATRARSQAELGYSRRTPPVRPGTRRVLLRGQQIAPRPPAEPDGPIYVPGRGKRTCIWYSCPA